METISSWIATFIINAMWQILALFIVAFICSRLLRPAAARYRYLLWTTALILSVALPVLSLFSLSGKDFKFVLPISLENNQSLFSESEIDRPTETGNRNSIQIREPSGNSKASVFLLAISICYFSFLAYRLVNLWIMWRRTGRLRRSAKNQPLPPLINAVAERCCAVLKLKPVPICFSAEETGTPYTLGARKPLIILPDNFLAISSEETLTAALGHELAHIRRRDYFLNVVCEFLSTLVWFHPAVTIIKRKINETRELACDELIAETLLKPLDYARSLIQIANFASPVNQNAYTLGVFNADILEKRIMKLIETNRSANNVFGKIRGLFVVTLLGITALAASVFSFDLPDRNIPASESELSATAKTGDIVPVQILSKPRPTYTDEARRNLTSGLVKLRVTFLDSGSIGEIIPVTRLADGLTEKAIEAAKAIKFKPATENGIPVTTTKLVTYSFTATETRSNRPPQ